jgi:5'-nucleotidase
MPPLDLSKCFVVGISSRALFDLKKEDEIFCTQGAKAYIEYQIAHEEDALEPGTGFPLAQAILRLNGETPEKKRVVIVVMSKNNAETSLRISKSIAHYGLDIIRGAYTSGAPLAPYLKAFSVDLFLSASQEDVQQATNEGFAAGLIYPFQASSGDVTEGLRIAFDGDAVLFSEDSEKIYKEKGLQAFLSHEQANANKPLPDGPFAKLFRKLAALQRRGDKEEQALIRTALVTARNSPADERVIKTLRQWNVRIDEVFFMGGLSKAPVLEAFKAHIFFDDQDVHCAPASVVVPTARVMIRDMKGEQVPLDFEVPVPFATDSIPKKEPPSVTAVIVPLPAEISHAKK